MSRPLVDSVVLEVGQQQQVVRLALDVDENTLVKHAAGDPIRRGSERPFLRNSPSYQLKESAYKKNAMCVESMRKGHLFPKRILFTRSVNRFQGKC